MWRWLGVGVGVGVGVGLGFESESVYLLYRKPVDASSPPPLGFVANPAPSSAPALLVEIIVYMYRQSSRSLSSSFLYHASARSMKASIRPGPSAAELARLRVRVTVRVRV